MNKTENTLIGLYWFDESSKEIQHWQAKVEK